jgi:high-affinity nickel-transport protein
MKFGLLTACTGLLAVNAVARLWAWITFSTQPALLGTAFLAWLFGLRHAFDADHIAAIDNVVRKLMQRDTPSLFVGLFFSLGHSTVVILTSVVMAVAAVAMQDAFVPLHDLGGVIGTSISAAFLLLLGLTNLFILKGIWTT